MLASQSGLVQPTSKPPATVNIGRVLGIYSLLALAVTAIFTLHLSLEESRLNRDLQAAQQTMLAESGLLIRSGYQRAGDDLHFLASNPVVTVFTQKPNEAAKQATQDMFVSFMQSHRDELLQVRLLDHAGYEIIRVNQVDGRVHVVDDIDLQSKAERYYFAAVSQLNPGEVYYSPIDLNIENNVLVLPLQPTFRLGTLASSANEEATNYVVVNYAGQTILDQLQGIADKYGMQLFIVDANGDWIRSPDEKENWAFMLNRESAKSFIDQHPTLWPQLTESQGDIEMLSLSNFGAAKFIAISTTGDDTRNSTVASEPDSQQRVYLIAAYPQNALIADKQGLFIKLIPVYLLLLVAIAVLAYFYVRLRTRHFRDLQNINQRHEDFETLVELAPDGMFLVSEHGAIEIANQQAAEIFRQPVTEMVGSHINLLIPERFHEEHEGYRHSFVASESSRPMGKGREIFGQRGDGSEFSAAVALHSIDGPNGRRVIVTVRDISAEKKLAATAQALLEQSKDSGEITRSLLLAITQGVRTQTQTIMGNVQLLAGTKLTEDQLDALQIIETATQSLPRLVNNLFADANVDIDHMVADPQIFALKDILDELSAIFDQQAQEKGLRLKLFVDASVPNKLISDPHFLRLVLIQLLHNAIAFTEHGEVSLKVFTKVTTNQAQYVIFEVTDTCSDLSVETRKRLFKPWVKPTEGATNSPSSPGLALSLVSRLIKLMDGTISVDDNNHQGLAFLVSIPFIETPQDVTPITHQRPSSAMKMADSISENTDNTPAQGLFGLRIIVADDDGANLKVAAKLLTSQGAIITACTTGKEVITHIKNSPEAFDVILMDLQMPDINGVAATKVIKAELKWQAPIIALTAHATEQERKEALAAGMEKFLTKPFDLKSMVAILRHYRQQTQAQSLSDQRYVAEVQGDTSLHSRESNRPWPPVPGINIEELQVRLHDDQELFTELFVIFIGELKTALTEAQRLQQEENQEDLKFLMHKVRSQATTLSAEDIAQASAKVEEAIKAGSAFDAHLSAWRRTVDDFLTTAQIATRMFS